MFLPLPGLQPLDFSKWSLPLPEAPATRGLPMPSEVLPDIGDQTASPWASGQKALALPVRTPSAPQRMLPVCQPRTIPACCTFPAGSTATELTHCSTRAASAAIEPVCYTIPTGRAATQEVNRKGTVGSTYFRWSRSCR